MPCFKPLNAWQRAAGQQPAFTPQPGNTKKLQLPCGQCIGCRLERSRQWATRCIHEASLHHDNCFITLTYDDENFPYGGSLVKAHFQKFIKRLRSKIAPKKVRYFMCGEYGDQLMRPHYHALLFGYDFTDRELWQSREGIRTYTSQSLEKLWPKGFSTIGDITWQTAAYCARYVTKKLTGKAAAAHYERLVPDTGEIIQLQPEYIAMSLKPAIGKDWYEAYKDDCYPSDFITNQGKKYRVPRYYDKLLEAEKPDELQRLKRLRQENAWQWDHEQTKERLQARETCTNARHNLLTRPYEAS